MLVKLLRRYLKPYKLALLCLIVFQIAQACLNLYLPNLQAEIIDKGVAAGDEHAIHACCDGLIQKFVFTKL